MYRLPFSQPNLSVLHAALNEELDVLKSSLQPSSMAVEHALTKIESLSEALNNAQAQFSDTIQLLCNIVESAPIGMCVLDESMHFFLVNKAFSEMVGYDQVEICTLTPMDITHPDDLLKSKAAIQQLYDQNVGYYHIEKRYIRKDKQVIWVRITTKVLRNPDSTVHYYVGQVIDITLARQQEEKLRLASTVYNFSDQAMMITDAHNAIVDVNPAFTAITGYLKQEVLGRNPNVLSSGRQDKPFYDTMWKALMEHEHWEGDIWNRKKNGEIYAEWLSISVVKNEQGEVQNFVGLFHDVTEKKRANDRVWEHANYDQLTRLPNRRLFYDRLDQGMRKCDRNDESLALLFLDLDHFKEVNDTLGHQTGDELLIQVANRIVNHVRASDTVARLGGDEFTVIIGNFISRNDVEKVAQSLVDVLSSPFSIDQHEIHISASIGVIFYPDDRQDLESLLDGADKAMYMSKKRGKHCYTLFEDIHKDVL